MYAWLLTQFLFKILLLSPALINGFSNLLGVTIRLVFIFIVVNRTDFFNYATSRRRPHIASQFNGNRIKI